MGRVRKENIFNLTWLVHVQWDREEKDMGGAHSQRGSEEDVESDEAGEKGYPQVFLSFEAGYAATGEN